MAHQYRLRFYLLALAGSGLFGGWQPAGLGAQVDTAAQDAELCRVFFADEDRGWVVGDRGVVWHTENGGRHWHRQETPVGDRLESVHFVDAENGWIVGTRLHRYTSQTSAVVLRTRDGGRHWTQISAETLPGLKYVRFENANEGWAVGNSSAMYPAGIFRSTDGGRSWTPLAQGFGSGWLAASFPQDRLGIAVGNSGGLALVSATGLRPTRTPFTGARPIRDVQLDERGSGWLVGEGGLILQTRDGGVNWQQPPAPLPRGVPAQFDFTCVCARGSQIWLAGQPGTSVLHSPDEGRSWYRYPTRSPNPIRDVFFVNERVGWAVGSLGTIQRTTDGGQSWQVQRTGGGRAAWMTVTGEAASIPYELLGLLAGDDGYLAVSEVLSQTLNRVSSTADEGARIHQSVVTSGGSAGNTTWRFPLRQAGIQRSEEEILRGWDFVNDGSGRQAAESYLVRKIRQWRPDLLVTGLADADESHPVEGLVQQIVLDAVEKAGDPTAYPDQITIAGLEPWKVKKVYTEVEHSQLGHIQLTTSQLATRLGHSLADQGALGRSLIQTAVLAPKPTQTFQLLINQLPQAAGKRDFFSGLYHQIGGETRRELSSIPVTNLRELQRAAQKTRNIEQLINAAQDGQPSLLWASQLDQMTRHVSSSAAGRILFQLADRYDQSGNPELAADTLLKLVQEHPKHELVRAAYVKLIQYYSSSEQAWRQRRTTRYASQAVSSSAQEFSVQSAQRATYEGDDASKIAAAAYLSRGTQGTASPQMSPSERAKRAASIAKEAQRLHPALFEEPPLRFPLAAAYRAMGLPRDAERYYHLASRLPDESIWASCGRGELWLQNRTGPSPKPVLQGQRTQQPPYLDGILDDELWSRAKMSPLKSEHGEDADWPAQVGLAVDNHYLYLAIHCRKASQAHYGTPRTARQRDQDLSEHDRVDILLDLDRDYATYYRFTVDHRGWARDLCCGDLTWNPAWHLAAHEDDQSWTLELAIPLNVLTPEVPKPRSAWAVGIQRTIPRVGLQSLSQPVGTDPIPAGFGYLIFD